MDGYFSGGQDDDLDLKRDPGRFVLDLKWAGGDCDDSLFTVDQFLLLLEHVSDFE